MTILRVRAWVARKAKGQRHGLLSSLTGEIFRPSMQVRWKTNEEGMGRLRNARRLGALVPPSGTWRYLVDFPAYPINNFWQDTASSFMSDKVYVVQTTVKIVDAASS